MRHLRSTFKPFQRPSSGPLTPFLIPFPPSNNLGFPAPVGLPTPNAPMVPFLLTSSSPSQPAPLNLTGFITDLQTVQKDVAVLKQSESHWNQTVVSQAAEFANASEVWCSVQSKLTNNQAIIITQDAEIKALTQEIQGVVSRRREVSQTLKNASNSLQTLFQTGKRLERNDGEKMDWSQGPAVRSPTLASLPKVTVRLYRLNESVVKRVTARLNQQMQLKRELARNNRILKQVSSLVSNGRSVKERKTLRRPRQVKGAPKDSQLAGNHIRDHSISWRDGFRCRCGEFFKNIQALNCHFTRVAPKKFSCEYCQKKTVFFGDLRTHMKRTHKKLLSSKAVGCRYCGKVYPDRSTWMNGWKHRSAKCSTEETQ